MNDNYRDKYISNRKSLIRVICRTGQWSGIEESDVFKWLNNFKDSFGQYIGLKLLVHSIYYSEKNIVSLLKHGIYELIHGQNIKSGLISRNEILTSRSVNISVLKELLQGTAYIPLLDSSKPGESSNQIIRYLIQKLNVHPSQTFFISDLYEEHIKSLNTIVFVDDCIGSGDQLTTFFENPENKKTIQLALKYNVQIYYLVITGYHRNIESVKKNILFKNIKIICCDVLHEADRVFNKNHIIWHDLDEFNQANAYFNELRSNFGIEQFGYRGLDFSVFMHRTIPDWSLPIFWMETADWTPLMKRKNSTNY